MAAMGPAATPVLAQPRSDDHYPSRFDPEPRTSPRLDPVHYSDPEGGPLSAGQGHFYLDQGYLHFEQLLSPDEVQDCLDEVQRLRGDGAAKASDRAVIEPSSGELRSLFEVHRSSQVLRRLSQHPKLVAIARQLLGSEVYIHQSRINYKAGFRGEAFYWHSDFETWHVEDGMPAMRAVSCSIALTPNTPYNGPLMVVPGSHQRFVSCVGATPPEHYKQSLRQQAVGVPDDESLHSLVQDFGISAPTGLAGDVTFFDCNLMHGSNSNITPMARSNLFIVFNSVHNALVAPFCGLAPRPNFIAERQDMAPLQAL